MKLGYYPDVVNENATRIVAFSVVVTGVASILFPNPYLLGYLLFGFTARLSYGPKYEPFAWLTANWIVPKLKVSFIGTAGPPKRFAQAIGFGFALASIVFYYLNFGTAYNIALGILVFFASLESFLGFCAGCFVFGILMKLGIIPKEICERCNNLSFNK